MFDKKQCFNCKKKIRNEMDEFTITMNTIEGKHTVKMCETCANQFDEIMKGIEEIQNEGLEPI